jgi:hypothetical protein
MPKITFVEIAAAILILGGAGPVHAQRGEEPPSGSPHFQAVAGALHTAPLHGDNFSCAVLNAGKQPIATQARIFSQDGADISSFLTCQGQLPPGGVCYTFAFSIGGDDFPHAYCRISVQGSTEHVRGALTATQSGYTREFDGQYIQATTLTTEAR